MGFDLFGLDQNGAVNDVYYRANIFGWPIIWNYMIEHLPENTIFTDADIREGQFNDGHKYSQAHCDELHAITIEWLNEGSFDDGHTSGEMEFAGLRMMTGWTNITREDIEEFKTFIENCPFGFCIT